MESEYVTCPSCRQEMTRAFYESQHKYQCKERIEVLVARSIEEKPKIHVKARLKPLEYEIPVSEIEKEMREHPWADRQIAEQISRDHRKLGLEEKVSAEMYVPDPYSYPIRLAIETAKSLLPEGSPRRFFVQDLAASLNRRGYLKSEDVDFFCTWGYELMKS